MSLKAAPKYFQSTELKFMAGLKQGDILYHESRFYNTHSSHGFTKKTKYIVQYPPVYFPISGNWAIRVTSKAVLEQGDTAAPRTVFLYANKLCIHKFYLPMHVSNEIKKKKSEDQLQSLIDNLNEEGDYQIDLL